MSLKLYNSSNEPLDHYYQWDVDQIIKVEGLDESAVAFHFANRKSSSALVVTPTSSGGVFEVAVPNILLQQAETLFVYVYADQNYKSARTVAKFSIAVYPRAKPNDYIFTENIEYLSASMLNIRLSEMISAVSSDGSAVAVEVADIRVKSDGTIYPTAGDSVRANENVINELSDKINEFDNITEEEINEIWKPYEDEAYGLAFTEISAQEIDEIWGS